MAISDLTGTTWVFNAISTDSFTAVGNQWDINFISNSTNYSILEQVFDDDSELGKIYYNTTNVFNVAYGDEDGLWEDEAYKTIEITGGTDVTNSTLISWLETNATQQSSQISVDLSTLSGWSDVTSGSHTLTIKAKATGYRDSEASTGVSFEKSGTTYTVNLRADNGYGAVPGHAPDGYVKYRVNGSTVGMITTYGVSTTLTNVEQLEINCNYNGGFINELRASDESFITDLSYDGDAWTDVSAYLSTIAAESYVVIYCED